MFTLIALAALPLAEPTPVGPELMETVIATGELGSACDSYGDLVTMIGSFGLDAESELIFIDMIDGYLIIKAEADAFRFDNEARDVLVSWLHQDCA